jgi:hypothetical protein
MRDPDNMDDVLKVESKGDDAYDGFRYGLFGYLSARLKPQRAIAEDRYKELLKQDPMAAWFYKQRMDYQHQNENAPFRPPEQPVWCGKS